MDMDCFKVNLFTKGDSRNIKTWSNLPYLFSRALVDEGVQVNRINLVPHESYLYKSFIILMRFWTRCVRRFVDKSYKKSTFRTKLNYYFTNRKIRRICRLNTEADLNVFLTFSFSSYKYADTPVAHYCDRTYEHYLKEYGKEKTQKDNFFVEVEKENLENADFVFATNKLSCDFIRDHYSTKNVFGLEAGVNLEVNDPLTPDEMIAIKKNSKDILFIGKPAYDRGADILVKAFKIFNRERAEKFRLHLVGTTGEELNETGDRVQFYGYLRKDVPEDLATYTRLLASAYLFVFPMRVGSLPTVVREAHLMCTPVIISNISNPSERVRNGHNGIIVDSLRPEDFAYIMKNLVEDKEKWLKLAKGAHESVKGKTWERTIKEFLQVVRK